MHQDYDTDVNKEYTIKGNSALLKCAIPSFVADFVSVTSWITNDNEAFYPSENYGNNWSSLSLSLHRPLHLSYFAFQINPLTMYDLCFLSDLILYLRSRF